MDASSGINTFHLGSFFNDIPLLLQETLTPLTYQCPVFCIHKEHGLLVHSLDACPSCKQVWETKTLDTGFQRKSIMLPPTRRQGTFLWCQATGKGQQGAESPLGIPSRDWFLVWCHWRRDCLTAGLSRFLTLQPSSFAASVRSPSRCWGRHSHPS